MDLRKESIVTKRGAFGEAGDTVLAALAAGMLNGSCLWQACQNAAHLGGKQVGLLGIGLS